MKHEDIIRLAIEHTIHGLKFDEEGLVRFANLVAQHTLSNIDPRSFMSYQEGMKAGRLAEREACAKVCEQTNDGTPYNLAEACAEAIRARGNHDTR
jgi:hypothetical protein